MFTNAVTFETNVGVGSFMGLGNCSIPMRLENGKRQLFILHARQTRRRSCLSMWRSDLFTYFTALLWDIFTGLAGCILC